MSKRILAYAVMPPKARARFVLRNLLNLPPPPSEGTQKRRQKFLVKILFDIINSMTYSKSVGY